MTEVTHQVGKNQSGLEGYSPFTSNTQSNSGPATSTVGPAIMHPTTQDISPNPPQYSKSPQSVAQYTVEELEVSDTSFLHFNCLVNSVKNL